MSNTDTTQQLSETLTQEQATTQAPQTVTEDQVTATQQPTVTTTTESNDLQNIIACYRTELTTLGIGTAILLCLLFIRRVKRQTKKWFSLKIKFKFQKPSLLACTFCIPIFFVMMQLFLSGDPLHQSFSARLDLEFYQILTAVGVLFGLLWTHQRILATEKTIERADANIELTRENNLNMQIKDSFALMASDKPEISIGGIYALGEIAFHNEEQRERLLGQLCIYVRTKSPNKGEDKNKSITADIQEALHVISRIKKADTSLRIDLFGANLKGAYLRDADLKKTDLRYTDLKNSYLEDTDLRGAELGAADLRGAYLKSADLRGTELRYIGNETDETLYASLGKSDDRTTMLAGAKFLYSDKEELERMYPEIKNGGVLWYDTTEAEDPLTPEEIKELDEQAKQAQD